MDITLDDRLSAFQQISQRKLVETLDSIPSPKDLIIEQKLMKILDSFIGVTVLRRCRVDKIFKLAQGLKPSNVQRVYIISCDLIACKRVLDQIQSELSQAHGLSHHMLVAPYVPIALRSLVEEEGLSGLVTLRPLAWEFIHMDGNVLSMEIPLFSDLYYHKETSLLPSLARNLWSLQMVLGAPKFTFTLGKHSRQILQMISTMEENFGAPNPENELGAFILMDRNEDFASTLLTSVTYIGLLSEAVEITLGSASVGSSQTKLDPKKDDVYREVRDRHFSDAFPTLRTRAKSLKTEQETMQSMKLSEMKHYVQNTLQKTTEIKKHLEFHILACETVVNALGSEFETLHSMEKSILECSRRKECLDYIERNIEEHPLRSLRLLSLLSITGDGITSAELQPIQKSHLHAHGYQNIPLFYKLETTGLINTRLNNVFKLPNWTSKWALAAKRMKLFPNPSKDLDIKGPTCPSYVFSGDYIPAIAQILNIITSQQTDPKSFEELSTLPGCSMSGQNRSINPKTVVVCLVGGITYGEISACRLVEKAAGIRLVLASDSIITGSKLIEGIQNA